MSGTLTWRPVRREADNGLPVALKRALLKCFGDGRGGFSHPLSICSDELAKVAYLRGLRDADVEGAERLLELIERHGEIELRVEF